MADLAYYQTRAARERALAQRQQHPNARHVHLVMAERYERLLAEATTR